MENKINVLIKKPGAPWAPVEVENRLEDLQRLVDGYIEVATSWGDIALIVNEEGKLRGLAPNFPLCGDVIVGTAVLIGVDGEDFTDCPHLTDEDLMDLMWAE